MNESNVSMPTPAAWIGLDWGDKEHAFALAEASGQSQSGKIAHSAENLHAWLKKLEERFGARPVFVAVEASRGAVIHALVQYPWLVIYPVNPVTSARFRTAFRPSGAKDDLPDAEVLLDLARHHSNKLRALEPQDPLTLELARRAIVDERTAVLNQLTSLLKSYYPQALELVSSLDTELAVDLLERWPDLLSLKAARPATVRNFYYKHNLRSEKTVQERLDLIAQAVALTTEEARVNVAKMRLRHLLDQLKAFQKHVPIFEAKIAELFKSHPDAHLFRDLPGAGAQMAPRLCVAFGQDRSVYPDPPSLQKYAGVAPVREKSGSHTKTHWRWNAPTFLRQTLVEWAGLSVRYSAWAKAYYEHMTAKGKKHHVIVRALAFKWIRILWKCWKDQTPYDEARYLESLRRRKSPHAVKS